MRKLALGALLIFITTPTVAADQENDDARLEYLYPSVKLDDGRFYPVHRGDGQDYCRDRGYRDGDEVRIGPFVDNGLARHKGDRWQYTVDGPIIARLHCF